jgi:hypothetical protein
VTGVQTCALPILLLNVAELEPTDLVKIMDKFVEQISNNNGDQT